MPRTIQAAEPRGENLRIGIVVARFNQAVTDALERVLRDEPLRARLAAAGRARAAAFDIGRAARRLQELYEEMMAA